MNISALSGALGIITTLGGGGYWVATELTAKADHAEVVAVNAKAEFVMDKQMESMLAQINKLEQKQGKTPDDIEQLRYLRDELKRLRDIRQR